MAELAIPDPWVVLLIGAAGSGKSTLAARHFAPQEILSSDALRGAIAGDEADQRATGAAFAALHRELERRLAAGRLTVIDATNVTVAARASIRRLAAAHAFPCVAIVLDLPAPLVQARNAARAGRVVPAGPVERQLARLAATLEAGTLAVEGYAAVLHLRDPEAVAALTIRRVPTPRAATPRVATGPGGR
ncbi:MAG: AAA family ATPase [Chloroflexi bacterium]|nr:AAA family ATPase [Chloroflexota bacterium]